MNNPRYTALYTQYIINQAYSHVLIMITIATILFIPATILKSCNQFFVLIIKTHFSYSNNRPAPSGLGGSRWLEAIWEPGTRLYVLPGGLEILDVSGEGDPRLVCADLGAATKNTAKAGSYLIRLNHYFQMRRTNFWVRNALAFNYLFSFLQSDTSLQRRRSSHPTQLGGLSIRRCWILLRKRRTRMRRIGRSCWVKRLHL